MCLNPILRPNPNWNGKSNASGTAPSFRSRIAILAGAVGKDVDNSRIYVPCGHCSECVAAKQNSLVQRIQMESKFNHLFFATLTYDNAHLPKLSVRVPVVTDETSSPECSDKLLSLDFSEGLPQDVIDRLDQYNELREAGLSLESLQGDVTPSVSDPLELDELIDVETGEVLDDFETIDFPYADIHHVQLLMKNLRDNNPVEGRSLRYLAVSELGKTHGRPHFHILFLIEKRPGDFIWKDGDFVINPAISCNLERCLYKAVFKYWAINVGTRKNPVYEKLFTYRKRFYGQKCYTNFDLHYVDPRKTTDGTSNVAFYVTKYILKGSQHEIRRQQFLRLNLSEVQYRAVWNTIKCRLLMSKGLGLDARFYTCDKYISKPNPSFSCCDYASALSSAILDSDDLPADDLALPSPTVITVARRRIMVPNFAITDEIRKNLAKDAGVSPGPIFIAPDGKHRPLSHYYQRFGFIFSTIDFLTIFLNYDDSADIPHYLLPKSEKDRLESIHRKRLAIMDRNSSFDTSPAFLWGGSDQSETNQLTCYGN